MIYTPVTSNWIVAALCFKSCSSFRFLASPSAHQRSMTLSQLTLTLRPWEKIKGKHWCASRGDEGCLSASDDKADMRAKEHFVGRLVPDELPGYVSIPAGWRDLHSTPGGHKHRVIWGEGSAAVSCFSAEHPLFVFSTVLIKPNRNLRGPFVQLLMTQYRALVHTALTQPAVSHNSLS